MQQLACIVVCTNVVFATVLLAEKYNEARKCTRTFQTSQNLLKDFDFYSKKRNLIFEKRSNSNLSQITTQLALRSK